MSRKANAARRCTRCLMHSSLCVCALLPRLETRTRIVLVIHRDEVKKPTNTGRLALECLANKELVVRGDHEKPSEAIGWPKDTQPVLLFPAEDAVSLADLASSIGDRPVTLVVPDGNWRQASKVRARVPGLRDVPCAILPPGPPSIYRLRSEAHGHGLATMEAIARALGILEGAEHGSRVQQALEHPFRVMVERTLWSRGALDAADVMEGVPEGALRSP